MRTNCSCKICKDTFLINFNESVLIMADDTTRPGSLKAQKLIDNFLYWLKFLFNIIFYIGPFFLGIVVGMGIVITNSPVKKHKEELDWKLQQMEQRVKKYEVESAIKQKNEPKTSFNLK